MLTVWSVYLNRWTSLKRSITLIRMCNRDEMKSNQVPLISTLQSVLVEGESCHEIRPPVNVGSIQEEPL